MIATGYRVTAKLPRGNQGRKHRVASQLYTRKTDAQKYADETNYYYPGANARVVKDSERVRRMIP